MQLLRRQSDDFAQTLAAAADQYIVNRGDQKTVIAGYHWFSDWGRDTMIALPGLTLATGRHDVGAQHPAHIRRQRGSGHAAEPLPRCRRDAGIQHGRCDALVLRSRSRITLHTPATWILFAPNSIPCLPTSSPGTRAARATGSKWMPSGLLTSGEPGVQLTWMDAKVGDWVVTPRRGKPVEIQALWYNALCIMEDLARRFGDEADQKRYRDMAAMVASWSFNRLFWNEKDACLYDVVNGGPPILPSVPNQIFAVSLPFSMLSPDRAKSVVEKVREHLLTPYGLRSLAPSDPQYRGRYMGGPVERDGAYHQGTVWPWLIGPFITAYVKVNGDSDCSASTVRLNG